MTEKIPIVFPDGINLGVWKHAWSTGDVYGHVAELCDGVFLFTPFETQIDAEDYVPDDSYCYAGAISCVGATALVALLIDTVTPVDLSLEINDDPVIEFSYSDPSDLVAALSGYADLSVGNDGWFKIENTSTSMPYRIKLTGDASTSITEFGAPFALNPAFAEIDNGCQFCLAAVEA